MRGLETAAVVTVGTELTTGHRLDTNGAEVARALVNAGFSVREMVSVPDDFVAIVTALESLWAHHRIVVVTGGLGPTHDDITREAAAHVLGRALVRDPLIAEALAARVAVHREPASAISLLHQADVIEGAHVLPATTGTAPGQMIDVGSRTLIILPGPPHEMRPMLRDALAGRSSTAPPVILRCVGITESDAGSRVLPLLERFPDVELTLLGGPGQVDVILVSATGDPGSLGAAAAAAFDALGDTCFSTDGSTLAATVVRLAADRSVSIATAESCTGGLVAAAITDVPGSSQIFRGSIVAYANDAKSAALSVDPALLGAHGAVSKPVALAMAHGALDLPGTMLAVATTGIAGPGGGTPQRPLGTVWFAVATSDGREFAERHRYGGDRTMVRQRACTTALDLLRRCLLER
ncbi:MAG: nicotinamide-nucleotide amidohydrolase family protein [Coriobacteriia bacterium]|nr:nicotinamide-nucleotide amidohydrolase family protein [Coriobacteriia bacterium]MBN2840931.1 nicotinamide-nucleotide amidohydrolase family protein [Coriobacteriia bacterium]